MERKLQILFGRKREWEAALGCELSGFQGEIHFGNFDTVDLESFDLIVPLGFNDYEVLRRGNASKIMKCLYPSKDAVDFCNDKRRLNRAVRETTLRDLIPPMFEAGAPSSFPYIVKKNSDCFGLNSAIIRSTGDAKLNEDKLLSDAYFFQECVAGCNEYASHLLMKDRSVIYSTTVTYTMAQDLYVKGHACQQIETLISPGSCFDDEFAKILEIAGFTDGTCCFDYKVIDGKPKIFEVNPRFGGSLVYDIKRYLTSYAKAVGS